jgi:hypothetical protein
MRAGFHIYRQLMTAANNTSTIAANQQMRMRMASSIPIEDGFEDFALPVLDVKSCEACGYVKSHKYEDLLNISFKSTHYTCICNLFSDSVVCCVDGYENLMLSIPILSIYTNLPVSYYWHMGNGYEADFNMRLARLNDQLVQQCAVIKVIAMNNLHYLSSHVSPVFVDDYTTT